MNAYSPHFVSIVLLQESTWKHVLLSSYPLMSMIVWFIALE